MDEETLNSNLDTIQINSHDKEILKALKPGFSRVVKDDTVNTRVLRKLLEKMPHINTPMKSNLEFIMSMRASKA